MTFEQFDENREEKAPLKPLDFTPFASSSSDFQPKDFGSKDSASNDFGTKDIETQAVGAKVVNSNDYATQVSSDINAQTGSDSLVKQGAIQYMAKGVSEESGEKVFGTKGSGSTEPVRYEKKRDEEFHFDDNKIAFGGISASDNAHAASIKLSDAAYAAPRMNRSATSDDAVDVVTSLGESKKSGIEGKSAGELKSGGEIKQAIASVEKQTKTELTTDPAFEKHFDKSGPSPAFDKLQKEPSPSLLHLDQQVKQPVQGADLVKSKSQEAPVRESIQIADAAKPKAPEVTYKEVQFSQPSKGYSEFPSTDGLLESMKTKTQIQKSDSTPAVFEQVPRAAELNKQPLQNFEPQINKMGQQGELSKAVVQGESAKGRIGEAAKNLPNGEPNKIVANFEPSKSTDLVPKETTRSLRNDGAPANNETVVKSFDNVGVKQNVAADTKLGASKGETGAPAFPGKLDVNRIETAPSKLEAARELTSQAPQLAGELTKANVALAGSNAKDLASQLPVGQRNGVSDFKNEAVAPAKNSREIADAVSQPKVNAFRDSVTMDSNIKTMDVQPHAGMKKLFDGKGAVSEVVRPQNLDAFRKDSQGITASGTNDLMLKKAIGESVKPGNSLPAESVKSRAVNNAQQVDTNKTVPLVKPTLGAEQIDTKVRSTGRMTETQRQPQSNIVEKNSINQSPKVPADGGLKGENSLAAGAAGAGVKAIREPVSDGGGVLAKAGAADKLQQQIGKTSDADLAKVKTMLGEKASSSEPIKAAVETTKVNTLGREANVGQKEVVKAVDQVSNKPNNFAPSYDAKRTETKPNVIEMQGNGVEGKNKTSAFRNGAEGGQKTGEQPQRIDGEPKTPTRQRIIGEEARGTDSLPKLNQQTKEARVQPPGEQVKGMESASRLGEQMKNAPETARKPLIGQDQKLASDLAAKGASELQRSAVDSRNQRQISEQTAQKPVLEQRGSASIGDQAQKVTSQKPANVAAQINSIDNTQIQKPNGVVNQRDAIDRSQKINAAEAMKGVEQPPSSSKLAGIENSIRAAADSTVPRSNVNLRGTVEATKVVEAGKVAEVGKAAAAGKVVDAGKVVEQGKVVEPGKIPAIKTNETEGGTARANETKVNGAVKANDSSRPADVVKTSTVDANGRAVDVSGRAVIGSNFKPVDVNGKSLDVNGKSFESRGKSSDGNFKLEVSGKSLDAGRALDSRVSAIINATNRRADASQADVANGGKRNQQQQAEPTSKQTEVGARQAEAGAKQQGLKSADAVSRQVDANTKAVDATPRQIDANTKQVDAASKHIEASRQIEASKHFEPGSKSANSRQLDPTSKQIESGSKQIDSVNKQLEPAARAEMTSARGRAFTAAKFGDVDVTAELKGTTLAAKLEVKKVGLGGANSSEGRANADVLQGFGGRFNSDGKWISTASAPVGRGDSNRYMTGLELALVLSIAGIAKYGSGDHRGYRMDGKIWSITNRHGETLIYVDGRKNPFKVSRTLEAGQTNGTRTDAASAIGKTIATAMKPFHIGSTLKGDTSNGAKADAAKGENIGKQIKAQTFVVISGRELGKSAKMSTLTMSGVERLGTNNVTDKLAGRNAQATGNIDTIGKIARFNVRQAVTAADFYSQNRSRYPGGFELAMVMTAAGLTRGTALDTVLNKPIDSTSGPADRSKWLSSNNHSSTPTGRGVFDGIAFGQAPATGEQSSRSNNSPFGDRYQDFIDRIDSYTKKYAQEAVMTGSTFAPTNYISDSTDELDEEADEALDKPEEEEAAPNSNGNVETVLRRPMWMIAPGETLDGIAEVHYGSADLGWLIADLNMHVIRQTYIDGKRVIELRSRQQIELPVKEDIEKFHKNRKKEQCADNLITVVVERSIDREVVEQSIGKVVGVKDNSNSGLLFA